MMQGLPVLSMTIRYRPVASGGKGARSVSLRHRLVQPREIEALLAGAGLKLIASWGSFDGRPLDPDDESGEQHIYLARTELTDTNKRSTRRVGSK